MDKIAHVNSRVDIYKNLTEKKAHFGAYVKLGEILNVINGIENHENVKKKYKKIIAEAINDNSVNTVVINKFKDVFNKLRNIITIGTKFTEEEIVQILTLRLELLLVYDILKTKDIILDFNFEEMDSIINAISQRKINQKDFNYAVVQLKKNWPFVIEKFLNKSLSE